MQLNQYLEENAIVQLDQKAGKDQGKFQVIIFGNRKLFCIFFIPIWCLWQKTQYTAQVNFKKLENSVKDRVEQYVTLQHSGDKEAVDK